MVVRFLPVDPDPTPARDRENLAEVLDLRSRLVKTVPEHGATAATADDAVDARTAAPQPAHGATDTLREDAVLLLARRALSVGELRRELLRRNHPDHDVEELLEDFVRSRYLDDAGLATSVVERTQERQRASRAGIRRKLTERLIPHDVIESALATLDPEAEEELLRETATTRAQRLRDLPRNVAERRLIAFLARRGWAGEAAVRVAREALASSDAEAE